MARSFLTIKFTSNTSSSTNWTWKNSNLRFKRFYVFFLCQFIIPDFSIIFLISRYGHVWNKQSLNSRTFSVVATYKIRISSVYIWYSFKAYMHFVVPNWPGPARRNGLARPGPTKSVPEHTPMD